MNIVIVIIHIFVSIALILIVLLQTGRGADIGAAFGGSSQTLFGSAGPASFLNKLTTAAAVLFMLTSLSMAYLSGQKITGSIIKETPPPVEQSTFPAPQTVPTTPQSRPSEGNQSPMPDARQEAPPAPGEK
ncbi:MAG: preprotein translocase subunit SecG [Deltaproteobacteria bacterium]|nr:preprotein translocase subunit SecG [Deltaproteobacteria bacterium]MBW2305296.1 preprotein translocase subunit SecG [Deltaproteobacteria bacterium]